MSANFHCASTLPDRNSRDPHGQYQGPLLEVESALDAWSKLPPTVLNAEATVGRICRTMHNPCLMWFGYAESDRPPLKGFFAGPSFEVDEQTPEGR